MDFTKTIKGDMEEKYLEMLDASIQVPFQQSPQIKSQQSYINNKKKYYERLETEKRSFNDAINTVNKRRKSRLEEENSDAEKRAYKKFRIRQGIRTGIFLLPLILCIVIGWDVFNPAGQYIKIQALENFSMGWAIALYVIFCLVSLIVSILLIVKMYQNEEYVNRKTIYHKKSFNSASIVVFILCLALVGANVYSVFKVHADYKITFQGGEKPIVEYVHKGDSITLPSATKSDDVYETFTRKYTFEGWLIDDVLYRKNDKFEPNGTIIAKAQFREVDWSTITFSSQGATITIEYDGKSETVKSGNVYELEHGTEITLSVSYSYSGSQTFSVNGKSQKTPYTFKLSENMRVSASSEDTSCLAAGTLVTLYDGTQKAVEDLKAGDILAVFDHETGAFSYSPLLVNVHAKEEARYCDVIALTFSNGTCLKIINEHGLYNKELNQYVYLNKENAHDFIGKTFVSTELVNGELVSRDVTLTGVKISNELTKVYNPASVWHINLIADGMLSLSAGMTNLFEYDENMRYDQEKMQSDINEYGMYTYDDFKDYVSEEVFAAFPFKYYKVAVEKGLFSYEKILWLIDFYNSVYSER